MTEVDGTHDPERRSWVGSANGHADFPIQNLPLGVFSPPIGNPRIGVAIGEEILDLSALADARQMPPEATSALGAQTLNAIFALPKKSRVALRHRISTVLSDTTHTSSVSKMLHPANACTMHMPASVGDYTDFYVGIHHAMNIGKQFRPDDPLLPNYKHVPIGYHGRASSLRPSDVPVRRPKGQRKPPQAEGPTYEATERLDYELELGIWIASGNALGEPIPVESAREHIAGLCLLNDWSARDFQAWEYQPLGPFLAKNFHSTISPWVVTAEALAPFWIRQAARPEADPQPLPYLWDNKDQASGALGIELSVALSSSRMRESGLPAVVLATGPASNMYWTAAQIVTHHTSNGCNLQPGDLLGTGTISTPDESGMGSLMELTKGGTKPIALPTGETRRFLEDGDVVTMTASASAKDFISIGFGACRAEILTARD